MEAVFFGSKNLHKISLNVPIFVLGGAEDMCTNFGRYMTRLHERLAALGHRKLTYKILAASRHASLNELNREEVFNLYLRWVHKALEKLPNGSFIYCNTTYFMAWEFLS